MRRKRQRQSSTRKVLIINLRIHLVDHGAHLQAGARGDHQKDELTDFFGCQFNLESMDAGLPSMDGKDVEDIFKGVLTDESQESQDTVFSTPSGLPTGTLLGTSVASNSPTLTPNTTPPFHPITQVNPLSSGGKDLFFCTYD